MTEAAAIYGIGKWNLWHGLHKATLPGVPKLPASLYTAHTNICRYKYSANLPHLCLNPEWKENAIHTSSHNQYRLW